MASACPAEPLHAPVPQIVVRGTNMMSTLGASYRRLLGSTGCSCSLSSTVVATIAAPKRFRGERLQSEFTGEWEKDDQLSLRFTPRRIAGRKHDHGVVLLHVDAHGVAMNGFAVTNGIFGFPEIMLLRIHLDIEK